MTDTTPQVRLSDDLSVFVMPLYAFDPATTTTTLIDSDALIEDSDPATGRVLVRGEATGPRLRVLDLVNSTELAQLTTDPMATGSFLSDGSVAIFSGRSVIRWHPSTGATENVATLDQLGLQDHVQQAAANGLVAAAVDVQGHLALFDFASGSTHSLSTTADPLASPTLTWQGSSIFWIDSDYSTRRFSLRGYDPDLGASFEEDLGVFLGMSLASWRQNVVLDRAMLGTGAPLSTLLIDDPTDNTVNDATDFGLARPSGWAFLRVATNTVEGEVLVTLLDDQSSMTELWLVKVV